MTAGEDALLGVCVCVCHEAVHYYKKFKWVYFQLMVSVFFFVFFTVCHRVSFAHSTLCEHATPLPAANTQRPVCTFKNCFFSCLQMRKQICSSRQVPLVRWGLFFSSQTCRKHQLLGVILLCGTTAGNHFIPSSNGCGFYSQKTPQKVWT